MPNLGWLCVSTSLLHHLNAKGISSKCFCCFPVTKPWKLFFFSFFFFAYLWYNRYKLTIHRSPLKYSLIFINSTSYEHGLHFLKTSWMSSHNISSLPLVFFFFPSSLNSILSNQASIPSALLRSFLARVTSDFLPENQLSILNSHFTWPFSIFRGEGEGSLYFPFFNHF